MTPIPEALPEALQEALQDKQLLLQLHQTLPTSGARAVQSFELDGRLVLAVPQLAEDKAGEPPYMNGGDSDIPLLLFRWSEGRFEPWQELPVSGGEDAEFFRIEGRSFLATAGVRSGSGPYDLNTDATIFEWKSSEWKSGEGKSGEQEDGRFEPFQSFPVFAAKQWRYFQIGRQHFLALAQGVVLEGVTPLNPHESVIFTWDGSAFTRLQTVPSGWGYNWAHFRIGEEDFLAYADHHAPSIVMHWNGVSFEAFQTFDGKGGRAFHFFMQGNEAYLAFAVLLGETVLYRWSDGTFVHHQTLSGPGGREFTSFTSNGEFYLVQVNFITGSPKDPKSDLESLVYRFSNGQMIVVEKFATLGATDATTFTAEGHTFVAVAESLSAEVRFRTNSKIYRVA